MKLLALIGAGVLAAATVTAAPADAQYHGRGYQHGYAHGGYRQGYGYRHRGYYGGGGWRHRHHYARCRYRRCW